MTVMYLILFLKKSDLTIIQSRKLISVMFS